MYDLLGVLEDWGNTDVGYGQPASKFSLVDASQSCNMYVCAI